jgi:hypothetical protein
MELYAAASARPTPWNDRLIEGTVMGSARQDAVLVTSPMISFNGRKFGVVPKATFDTQIVPDLQRRGGKVVFV